MKNKKLALAIVVQFFVTIYIQRSAACWMLLFLTLVNYIIITKIGNSAHKIYKLSSSTLYLSVYLGTVMQIMAHLVDALDNKILYMVLIPAVIGCIVLFVVVMKEIFMFANNYNNSR